MSLLKRNDAVVVIAGKDRGKKGKILEVFPKKDRALVEGVNLVKRHTRQRRQDQKGGILTVERPLALSKLQYFCSRCARPVRLGVKVAQDGSKNRICRRCKAEVA